MRFFNMKKAVMFGCLVMVPLTALADATQTNTVKPAAAAIDNRVIPETGTVEAGKAMTIDLGDGATLAFVWVDALAGWVGKYEVTNGEYRRFKSDHNSGKAEGQSLNEDRQPVVNVSYDNAVAFAEWANRQAKGLPRGCTVRLPGGQEWMAFAQCGDARTYPWGNKWPPKYGNYDDTMDDYKDGYVTTCAVEDSGKNPWGLYGVGGNAWEWTSEQQGTDRVLRGASWGNFDQDFLECTHRLKALPVNRDIGYGFRLVVLR